MIVKYVLLCLVVMFIAGCDSTNTDAPESDDPALYSARKIFEVRCSMCHNISRPLGKHKTPAEWNETVSRMQKKAPDKISDADVKKVVAYLKAVRGAEK